MAASISLGIRVRVNNGAAREDRLEVDPLSLNRIELRQHLYKEFVHEFSCIHLYVYISRCVVIDLNPYHRGKPICA